MGSMLPFGQESASLILLRANGHHATVFSITQVINSSRKGRFDSSGSKEGVSNTLPRAGKPPLFPLDGIRDCVILDLKAVGLVCKIEAKCQNYARWRRMPSSVWFRTCCNFADSLITEGIMKALAVILVMFLVCSLGIAQINQAIPPVIIVDAGNVSLRVYPPSGDSVVVPLYLENIVDPVGAFDIWFSLGHDQVFQWDTLYTTGTAVEDWEVTEATRIGRQFHVVADRYLGVEP